MFSRKIVGKCCFFVRTKEGYVRVVVEHLDLYLYSNFHPCATNETYFQRYVLFILSGGNQRELARAKNLKKNADQKKRLDDGLSVEQRKAR